MEFGFFGFRVQRVGSAFKVQTSMDNGMLKKRDNGHNNCDDTGAISWNYPTQESLRCTLSECRIQGSGWSMWVVSHPAKPKLAVRASRRPVILSRNVKPPHTFLLLNNGVLNMGGDGKI